MVPEKNVTEVTLCHPEGNTNAWVDDRLSDIIKHPPRQHNTKTNWGKKLKIEASQMMKQQKSS